MTNRIGLYMHIPFCKSKCPYCDFFSGKGSETDYDNYTTPLKEKIIYWGAKATPNLYRASISAAVHPAFSAQSGLPDLLSAILSSFSVLHNAEITCEVNPESGKALDFQL